MKTETELFENALNTTRVNGKKLREYINENYISNSVLDKIRAEIEQVKYIMNEEIINHDRKDLINFVNGLNQSLAIIDKYKTEKE